MTALPGISMATTGVSAPTIINSPVMPNGASPAYLLGLVANVSANGTLSYSVQVTADQNPSAGGFWNNHDVIVSLTTSKNSIVDYPVTGVRLNVGSYSSGTVNLAIALWP